MADTLRDEYLADVAMLMLECGVFGFELNMRERLNGGVIYDQWHSHIRARNIEAGNMAMIEQDTSLLKLTESSTKKG